MTSRPGVTEHPRLIAGDEARERLLAAMPVTQRQLPMAGVSTAVLEGGAGPDVVLLHGPGGNATHWLRVVPDLVPSHHVIVPDLPGQGASELTGGPLAADRVLAWLGDLIEHTCTAPPMLVGHALGGAIAARFAVDHGDRLRRLVLVDAFGLSPFEPAPDFGLALNDFRTDPSEHTHDQLWRFCAVDLDSLRHRMGGLWEPFRTYNVDRARRPAMREALGVLMEQFGGGPIPPAGLARIAAPTALVWGRHDLATPVRIAEAASARYGWPLQVIENCADDPPVEAPEALARAAHRNRHRGATMTSTMARGRSGSSIVTVAPVVLMASFVYHPYIPDLTDKAAVAAALTEDTARWGFAHLAVGVGSALVVLAFLAIHRYLREAGEHRWSALGVPFIVLGGTLFAFLPAMEIAMLGAAGAGVDVAAVLIAMNPWFLPISLAGTALFALGALGFAAGIVSSRVMEPEQTWLVVAALIVAAAARFVPLGPALYVGGAALIVALWPLAFEMSKRAHRVAHDAAPVHADR